MRSIITSVICVLCLTLAGCGDDAGGDSSAVGTWMSDFEAMKALVKDDAMKKRMDEGKNRFTGIKVSIKADGTYLVEMGGKEEESGDWSLDGEAISFTAKMTRRGDKLDKIDKPQARKGSLKGGTITYKPDDMMPFDFVFKKQ